MRKDFVHISPGDKFIGPFIELLRDDLDGIEKHVFFIHEGSMEIDVPGVDIIKLKSINRRDKLKKILSFVKLCLSCRKIILHGLFSNRVILALFAMPVVLKKCYWIMWGGDLYEIDDTNTFKGKTLGFLKRSIIQRFGFLVSGTTGDYFLAKKKYGASGVHVKCFNYPSNIFKPVSNGKNISPNTIRIMVGNSATKANNHLEIFSKLSVLSIENCRIYAPLSYGDPSYREEICEKGSCILGEFFFPITEFMKIDDYNCFLSTIDIAIFDHERQQALGNIIALLGLGKKVFINSKSTLYEMLSDMGVTIFDSSKIELSLLSKEVSSRNSKIIEEKFSKENLVKSLRSWL